MKKFLALILALVMAVALLAGCGSSSTAPAASAGSASGSSSGTTFEPMTWKFACSATQTSTWAQAGQKFGDLVSAATNGAVKVEIYPADQLTAGNQADGIQALIDGTTDLSMHSNLIYSAFDQRFNVVSLPFLFSSTDDADSILDGAGGDALKTVLDGMGLHCIGLGENGFRHPTNSKHAIASVADMKNLKMRVAGSKLLNREYQLWGADYANANWSEVFTALQTGTYDGQENPLPTADSASIQEVQKYVTYWTGTYDCLFFCMNKDLYDSLPADLQKIVDDCGKQAVEYQRQINRDQDKTILDKWKTQYGITVTELTDEAVKGFKDASAACYTEFQDQLTPDLINAFTGK